MLGLSYICWSETASGAKERTFFMAFRHFRVSSLEAMIIFPTDRLTTDAEVP